MVSTIEHWKCTICSYEYYGEDPYETCPYCNSKCTFINLSADYRTHPELLEVPA
jgi:rubredoxin